MWLAWLPSTVAVLYAAHALRRIQGPAGVRLRKRIPVLAGWLLIYLCARVARLDRGHHRLCADRYLLRVAVLGCAPPTVFYEATSFNQDVSGWDTSSVMYMHTSACGSPACPPALSQSSTPPVHSASFKAQPACGCGSAVLC